MAKATKAKKSPKVARRRPRRSSLQALDGNLQTTIDFVSNIEGGIDDGRKIVSDLDDVLGYPAKLEKDLKKTGDILSAVETVASLIKHVPEVGAPAAAVSSTLRPMVKIPKPPGGAIGEIRVVLRDVNKLLEPTRDMVKKIKKPFEAAHADVDQLRTRLILFQRGVQELIRQHANRPPPGVEQCASRLNGLLEKGMAGLKAADRMVTKSLAPLTKVLAEIEDQLNNLKAFIDTVGHLLSYLTGKAFKQFQHALDDIKRNVKALIAAGKTFIRWLSKKLGIPIDEVINGLHRLQARIEGFISDLINKAVQALKKQLEALVKKIPGYDEFKTLVEALQKPARELRDLIEDQLGKECAKTLSVV